MRLAIDCRQLALGPSGDRTYLLSLLREYASLAADWPVALCYGARPETGLEGESLPAAFEVHQLAVRLGWLWTPWAWRRFLGRWGAQAAHAQYLVPPVAPCPTVVTIHDVSFLRHPEWFPRRAVRIMRRLIPRSARRATRIITGSRHAAGEIAELCRVPLDKIVVTPYATGPGFTPGDQEAARTRVAAEFGLTTPYVLAVGLIQPRKNLPRLLEAFRLIAPDHPGLALAVVGRAGPGTEEVTQKIAALGLAKRVHLCGAAPDEALPDLYRAAELLVYPSLYEGFGLPPLEAMACGTPVVASNTTALPEVVGEGGVLIDPLSVEAIAAGMRQVLDSRELAARLSAAGLARAGGFSWRRCAEQHLAVFREL